MIKSNSFIQKYAKSFFYKITNGIVFSYFAEITILISQLSRIAVISEPTIKLEKLEYHKAKLKIECFLFQNNKAFIFISNLLSYFYNFILI